MKAVTMYESSDGRLFRSPAEAEARDAHVARQEARDAVRREIEAEIPTFGPDEAFAKMEAGVWMACSSYTLRNGTRKDWGPHFGHRYGEYWSYGDYPGCVRVGPANTLSSVLSIGGRLGTWRETFGPDGKVQWPVPDEAVDARMAARSGA